MPRRILVPISADELAVSSPTLAYARDILDGDGEIVVLTVLEVPPSYIVDLLPKSQRDSVIKSQNERLEKEMDEIEGATKKIVYGHPARAILDAAEDMDADLIVLPAQRSGAEKFFLGSTATRVVRRANCSVYVMR